MNTSVNIDSMSTVRFKLAEFLKDKGITRYKLGDNFGHKGNATAYRLASETNPLIRLDLRTLGRLMDTLEEITGEDVQFDDLLERVEESN